MRVRILKSIAGVVQGVSLAHLHVGQTYDIDATLGRYLVSIGAAEAVPSSGAAPVSPLNGLEDSTTTRSGTPVTPVVEAADKPRPKRSARRKKR